MKVPKLLGAVQPFIAAAAVIITASILVFSIYYTLLDLEWVAFLAGTLFAAILAMVSRAARAEFAAANVGARLAVSQEKLSDEIARRESAESRLQGITARLQYADEWLPIMVAFIDREGIFRYHNQAYRQWMDLPRHRIDGNHLRRVLGRSAYAQVESAISRTLSGETVRYERTQRMVNGTNCRLSVQLLPASGSHGKTGGFFVTMEDVTKASDLQALHEATPGGTRLESDFRPEAGRVVAPQESALPGEVVAVKDAHRLPDTRDIRERILAAFERNEFALLYQKIKPLDEASCMHEHYEVLIRLIEEEDNMIPPGAFFPLAEEHGLLPHLDRWVVTNILKYLAGDRNYVDGEKSVYFINIAPVTLSDPDFPDYVEQCLTKSGVPGKAICFEVMGVDMVSRHDDAKAFIQRVRQIGCRVALCGFGRDQVSIELLKHLSLDFLKIDGGVILQLLKDPAALGKITAINRIAKGIGIVTIAEMVEDKATANCLRQARVDFAQGFGISPPRRLHMPTSRADNRENDLEFGAGNARLVPG